MNSAEKLIWVLVFFSTNLDSKIESEEKTEAVWIIIQKPVEEIKEELRDEAPPEFSKSSKSGVNDSILKSWFLDIPKN